MRSVPVFRKVARERERGNKTERTKQRETKMTIRVRVIGGTSACRRLGGVTDSTKPSTRTLLDCVQHSLGAEHWVPERMIYVAFAI